MKGAALFVDMAKTFDSVDHAILLNKDVLNRPELWHQLTAGFPFVIRDSFQALQDPTHVRVYESTLVLY